MSKNNKYMDWEYPELEEWEDENEYRNDDRCWPFVAIAVAAGAAYSSCRPRYHCYPRTEYCRPYYSCYPNSSCSPYSYCYPRPCRPL